MAKIEFSKFRETKLKVYYDVFVNGQELSNAAGYNKKTGRITAEDCTWKKHRRRHLWQQNVFCILFARCYLFVR